MFVNDNLNNNNENNSISENVNNSASQNNATENTTSTNSNMQGYDEYYKSLTAGSNSESYNSSNANNMNTNSTPTSSNSSYDDYYKSLKEDHPTLGKPTSVATTTKRPRSFTWLFIVFGLIFAIIGGVLAFTSNNKAKTFKEVEAAITSIVENSSDSYTTYVDYEVDGVQYSHVALDTYSSNYFVGKKITIYYNPSNPNEITDLNTTSVVAYIFIGIGSVVAIVGIILTVRLKKDKDNTEKNGEEITYTTRTYETVGSTISITESSDGKYISRSRRSKGSSFLIALIPFGIFTIFTGTMINDKTNIILYAIGGFLIALGVISSIYKIVKHIRKNKQ